MGYISNQKYDPSKNILTDLINIIEGDMIK